MFIYVTPALTDEELKQDLRRAMEFIVDLLRRLHNDRQVELPAAATAAYDATLQPFHGWITSGVFSLAMKVPRIEVHGTVMCSASSPSMRCSVGRWSGVAGCGPMRDSAKSFPQTQRHCIYAATGWRRSCSHYGGTPP